MFRSSICWSVGALGMRSERSHSVLDEHSTKETPTVERRIRTSQLAPLHERITVGHELGPTRRNETQPYAIIRSMHTSELEHRRLIEYALARRPEYVLRDGESASFDRELIHMAQLGTHDPRRIAGNKPTGRPDNIFGPMMSNCSDVSSGLLNELCA